MTVRILSVLCAGLLPLFASCHRAVKEARAPQPAIDHDRIVFPDHSPALASLQTATIAAAQAAPLRLNGRLVWDEDVTVRIFAPFAGRTERILADVAQPVRPGDTLALIASPDYAQARADAAKAAADATLAQQTYDRIRMLFDHGAAAQKDVEAAAADLARARVERARAETTLALRDATGRDGDVLFPLKTSIGGEVVERNVSPGQEVRPDQMLANAPQFFAPLFVVSNPTQLWVLIDATEKDVATLKRGARFTVRTPAFPDRAFAGTIDWISASLDPTTRMVTVRGRVPNPERLLKAEMFVSIAIPTDGAAQVQAPASAIVMHEDRYFAFVEERAGVYARREVRVGAEHGEQVRIVSGLKIGEHVVTEGALLLDDMLSDASGA